MLNVFKSDGGPFRKSDLNTSDILVDRIKGLYRAEEYAREEARARWDRETKERYSHDEIHGKSWQINAFVDVPIEFIFNYVANPYSLEEWTYGIRDLKHIGNNIYKGHDRFFNETEIFIKSEPQLDAKTVDYHFAWDQKEELWMRKFFRFVDAKGILNRSGTVLNWWSFKHPFYDKKLAGHPAWLKDAQNKRGRDWIGDHWQYFYVWHKTEADNLRYILEHRYHNKK